jgi:MFS family permease
MCSAVFQLGNSSDAFLILRAQERGLELVNLLWMLLAFNAVYASISAPAGSLSDRIPRKWVLLAGWTVYSVVYVGFAMATAVDQVVTLFILYGAYHGLAAGAAKALVADLVEPELRGTAYGSYHAVLGLMSLPASILAGLLWQGWGSWQGFGPSAPFAFGAVAAGLAAVLLVVLVPGHNEEMES